MVAEAPRYITFALPGQEKSVDLEKIQKGRRGFFEYGPIAGRPESSEVYWVPIDWMAWKLLVDVLGIPPEKLK